MLIAKDSWCRRFNRRRSNKSLLDMGWHERWLLEMAEEEEKQLEEKRKARRRMRAEKLKEEMRRGQTVSSIVVWRDGEKKN